MIPCQWVVILFMLIVVLIDQSLSHLKLDHIQNLQMQCIIILIRYLDNLLYSCITNILLTHCGWGMHICVGNLTIIGSDNGLVSGRRQAIIWTNAGIFFIGPLRINFSEILIKSITFSLKKMCFNLLSAKRWPFCLDGLTHKCESDTCMTGWDIAFTPALVLSSICPWVHKACMH